MLGLTVLPSIGLLAVFLAVWPWTSLYDRRPTVRLLATLVMTSGVQVGLQIVLGAFGVLAAESLWVATGCLALTSILVWSLRAGSSDGWWPRLARPTLLGSLLGTLCAATYAGLFAAAALIPPYGWDTLVYHLTDVFHIAQTGALEPFAHPSIQYSFPLVGELHSSWFYLLSGAREASWRLVGVALIPLALMAGVATRATAEALGFERTRHWLLPATLLAPLFLIQPLAGYVDGVFAALVLAAFAFAVLAARDERPGHLAFVALASGLALGTKLTFVYFCLPILLVLAVPPVWRALAERPVAWIGSLLLLFAVGCGFWLTRNTLRHGNPLFPLEVRVGSVSLLPGPAAVRPGAGDRQRFVGSAAGWLAYPFGESYRGRIQYSVDNGLGPLFAAGLVLSPFALIAAGRRRDWLLARALAALPLTLILWFAVSPFEHPRYVLAGVAFALLTLASVVEQLERAPLRIAQAALVLGVLFSAVVGLLNAAPELPQVVDRWRAESWSAEDFYLMQYGAAGEAFNWLASTPAHGSTLSFDRGLFVAPLFGWHGRNRVVYAAGPGDPEKGAAHFVATSADWRRYLREEEVDWFVVWRDGWLEQPELSIPERWLASSAEDFELVAEFARYASIFRTVEGIGVEADTPTGPSLDELSVADRWVLEFSDGAEGRPVADPAGGVRIDYRFTTTDNDYLDLRFDLSESGWPSTAELAFDLEAEPTAAALYIYLKEADPRQQCRFRVDLSTRRPSAGVRLDLGAPEARTSDFDPERVAELHLVLDDQVDAQAFGGTIRVSDFRLELQEETT